MYRIWKIVQGPAFVLTLLSLLFFVVTTVAAHDMYMWPKSGNRNLNEVNLTMMLEKEEVVWFDSMTTGLRMEGPSGKANLAIPDDGDPVIQFAESGTYVIGWESKPIFLEVEPEIFENYIRLEGYPEAGQLRKKWNQQNNPGREFYTRFIKTYIQIGATTSEDFRRPFGYKIEIIPLQNPCSLRVNSDLDVLVLYDGKPYANRKIMGTYDSYSTEPEDYAQVTRTDENGIAKFRITNRGLWLIRTNEMLPLDDGSNADWQSFWANVTFEVK